MGRRIADWLGAHFLLILLSVGCISCLNPTVANMLSTLNSPQDEPAIYAYVADGEYGFKLLDVTNVLVPTLISSLDTDGQALDIEAKDDTVYLADGTGG